MVSLCSRMTDGASSLQRRAFGNGRKGGEKEEEEEELVVVGVHGRGVAVALYTGDNKLRKIQDVRYTAAIKGVHSKKKISDLGQ